MHFKTLFKFLLKQGSCSSVAFYARADMQTKELRSSVASLARADYKLMKKYWMHDFHARRTLDLRSSVRLRSSLERECSCSSGLQNIWTSRHMHFTLERDFLRSSGSACTQSVRSNLKSSARAWIQNLEFPYWSSSTKLIFKSFKLDSFRLIFWKTLGNP